MQTDQERQHLQANAAHYETNSTVATLNRWYTPHKEVAFFDFVRGLRSDVFAGRCIEVGGGAGVHGSIVAKIPGCDYLHSDYSFALCQSASERGLSSIQCSGLDLPFSDASFDGVMTVGVSTLIGAVDRRNRQFDEFARILKPGGRMLIIMGRYADRIGQHCFDEADLHYLQQFGFKHEPIRFWGAIPGRFWKPGLVTLCRVVERLLSPLGFGARKIIILEKAK